MLTDTCARDVTTFGIQNEASMAEILIQYASNVAPQEKIQSFRPRYMVMSVDVARCGVHNAK